MKTKNLFLKLFISAALAAFVSISGCKKDDTKIAETDITSQAIDFEQGEQISGDIDDMADEAYLTGDVSLRMGEPGAGNSILTCATVTNDTINQVITIDFGSGCLCNDGRFRSGQIMIQYNGQYMDPGFTRSISFNNFFVDSNQVTGTRSIVNNGLNGNGNLTWTINAQNMRVTRPGGYYHQWTSTRTREMIDGILTPNIRLDDVYLITGSGTFSNSNGGSTLIVILTPLRKELDCYWIVSGSVEVSPANRPVRTLDYGNGTCDHFATVTINGVSHIIILH